MMFLRFALLVLSMLSLAAAQQPAPQPSQQKADTSPGAQPAREPSREDDPLADGVPVVTHHQITVNGKPLKHTATAGRLLLKPESGATEAAIFFTSYTFDGEDARTRPLTFVFNGGPGTATAWLHMGALGPRKIKLEADGGVPAPPYVTVDNPETILDRTDLVFIDAPGTGYSRVRADLTKAMAKNKYLRVLVMEGMYDLATPFYASAYTFQHLRLDSDHRKNLTFADFKGGHMVYNDAVALKEMKRALDAWYQEALRAGK